MIQPPRQQCCYDEAYCGNGLNAWSSACKAGKTKEMYLGIKWTQNMDDIMKNGIILHEGDGGFIATGFTPAPPNVLTEGSCFNLHFDQKFTRQLKQNHNLSVNFDPDFKVALPKKGMVRLNII